MFTLPPTNVSAKAMRLLATLHASPQRTIRVLCGGEERGMLGSRAYREVRTRAVRRGGRTYLHPDYGDFENYDVRSRHTNVDLADAVRVEDVQRSAVLLAVFA